MVIIRSVCSTTDHELTRQFLLSFPVRENGFYRPGSEPGREFDITTKTGFSEFIMDAVAQKDKGRERAMNVAPQTYFWFIEKGEFVGVGKVRHYLDFRWLNRGGHIAYAVAPKFRNKGIATDATRQMIEYARNHLEQDKLLITIRKDNPEECRKVALANGFILDEDWSVSREIAEKKGIILPEGYNGDDEIDYYWL